MLLFAFLTTFFFWWHILNPVSFCRTCLTLLLLCSSFFPAKRQMKLCIFFCIELHSIFPDYVFNLSTIVIAILSSCTHAAQMVNLICVFFTLSCKSQTEALHRLQDNSCKHPLSSSFKFNHVLNNTYSFNMLSSTE